MADTEALVLPAAIVRRVRREAQRLGLTLDEYLIELLSRDLDPQERILEYIEAARDLIDQAHEEIAKGDIRQAAEKLWGAAALAVKAYALWRDGRRLTSHRELWEYKRRLESEIGEWIRDAWAHASVMHTCFYEGWCTRDDVEYALRKIRKLVEAVEEKVAAHKSR